MLRFLLQRHGVGTLTASPLLHHSEGTLVFAALLTFDETLLHKFVEVREILNGLGGVASC